MFNRALVESNRPGCRVTKKGGWVLADQRHDRQLVRLSALVSLALLAPACQTKPKLPPRIHPSVEVSAPLKSDVWKQVATDADESRLARLAGAWDEALAEARRSNPADVR